jgi:hypothetical protein
MTAAVSVQVLTGDAYTVEKVPVPIDGPGASCRVRLQSLTGAQLTQVPVIKDGAVVFRVEVPCEGDETIVLDLEWHAQRGLLATAVGKNLLTLPGDDRYAPPVPWRPVTGNALDLCFLVDGTTLTLVDTSAGGKRFELLLDEPTHWQAHVDQLLEFAAAMEAAYANCRTSVLAFGDHEIEDVEAADLRPAYVLSPAPAGARQFRPLTRGQLHQAFLDLAPTPGGDFVDALGDALVACEDLGWRPGARKLLVVSGDSPGFSIRYPAPLYADSHVRRYDVDEAADRLRGRHVEVMTIFHHHRSLAPYETANPGRFLDTARDQYQRLASCAAYAFERSAFHADAAARVVQSNHLVFGGTSALGLFREIVPLDGAS